MKKFFLLFALAILSLSTASALEPIKVALFSPGAANVQVILNDYTGGTATPIYTGPSTLLTPNGSGIIIINIANNTATTDWADITAAQVNSYYVLDILVGGTLTAQYRLDRQIISQSQGGVFDNEGNLSPSSSGAQDLGNDDTRWGELFVEGNTIHVGPAGGMGTDELAFSYNDASNTATMTVAGASALTATAAGVTIQGTFNQNTGQVVFGGNVDMNDGLDVLTGNLNIGSTNVDPSNGNTLIGGTLQVTGTSTMNGNTSVSGTNTFTVGTGATTLGGTLAVTEESLIDGLSIGQGGGNIANNTAIGVSALAANTTGNGNTAFGGNTLINNTTGSVNTAIGNLALFSNVDGENNTAVGRASLQANTSGNNNTAMGRASLYLNETGSNNTANGGEALRNNLSGNNNTAIGVHALFLNTIGNYNSANGNAALFSNTEGDFNTATGRASLFKNSTGNSNTATGNEALRNNETGNYNTANGVSALFANTSGNYNTANGYHALDKNISGSNNTANGYNAGNNLTTGSENIFIGRESGSVMTLQKVDAINTIAIGYLAYTGGNNSIAIGGNTHTTADNQVVIGDANITETQLRGVKLMDMTGSGNQNLIVDNNGNIVAGGGTVATNSSLIGDGSGTPLGINLANSNTWTGVQTFNGATTNLGGSLVLSGSSNISNSSSPDLFVNDNLRLTNDNDLVMSGTGAVIVNYTNETRVGDDFAVGAPGGGSDVFNVALASGNTTVGGDVTLSNLAGGGNQNLHVDNTGKLVAGDGSGGFIVSISNNLGTLNTTYEDTGIQFPVDANSTYLIKGYFQVDDQGTNGTVDGRLYPDAGANITFADFRTFGYELFFTLPIEFTNLEADDAGVNPDRIDGIFRTGNAGLIKFQIRKSPGSPNDVDFDSGGQVTLIKLL